jgi:hypothetical protein
MLDALIDVPFTQKKDRIAKGPGRYSGMYTVVAFPRAPAPITAEYPDAYPPGSPQYLLAVLI